MGSSIFLCLLTEWVCLPRWSQQLLAELLDVPCQYQPTTVLSQRLCQLLHEMLSPQRKLFLQFGVSFLTSVPLVPHIRQSTLFLFNRLSLGKFILARLQKLRLNPQRFKHTQQRLVVHGSALRLLRCCFVVWFSERRVDWSGSGRFPAKELILP